jgi:hypothetical protein
MNILNKFSYDFQYNSKINIIISWFKYIIFCIEKGFCENFIARKIKVEVLLKWSFNWEIEMTSQCNFYDRFMTVQFLNKMYKNILLT